MLKILKRNLKVMKLCYFCLELLQFETGFSSEFPEGETTKASLEIANLITFPVCKSSSTNRPQKQDILRSIRQVLAIMQKVDELVYRLINYKTSLCFFPI